VKSRDRKITNAKPIPDGHARSEAKAKEKSKAKTKRKSKSIPSSTSKQARFGKDGVINNL
jgi:hypothetical protein